MFNFERYPFLTYQERVNQSALNAEVKKTLLMLINEKGHEKNIDLLLFHKIPFDKKPTFNVKESDLRQHEQDLTMLASKCREALKVNQKTRFTFFKNTLSGLLNDLYSKVAGEAYEPPEPADYTNQLPENKIIDLEHSQANAALPAIQPSQPRPVSQMQQTTTTPASSGNSSGDQTPIFQQQQPQMQRVKETLERIREEQQPGWFDSFKHCCLFRLCCGEAGSAAEKKRLTTKL